MYWAINRLSGFSFWRRSLSCIGLLRLQLSINYNVFNGAVWITLREKCKFFEQRLIFVCRSLMAWRRKEQMMAEKDNINSIQLSLSEEIEFSIIFLQSAYIPLFYLVVLYYKFYIIFVHYHFIYLDFIYSFRNFAKLSSQFCIIIQFYLLSQNFTFLYICRLFLQKIIISEQSQKVNNQLQQKISQTIYARTSSFTIYTYLLYNLQRFTVAQMAAIGLGLQRKIFTNMMDKGPHLLAPTGSDLIKYDLGTVFAGFHYDFNFLTIHGKSRYPGLFAWLRTGQKFTVSVPQGHLLLQSGKQFEYLTGGYINCGYHEVVYTEQVKEAKDKAIKQGKIPWRVSSTLFSHIRGDVMLKPLQKFASPETNKNYPPISGYDHALQQIEAIYLK